MEFSERIPSSFQSWRAGQGQGIQDPRLAARARASDATAPMPAVGSMSAAFQTPSPLQPRAGGQKRPAVNGQPEDPRRRPRQHAPVARDVAPTCGTGDFSFMAEAVAELDAAWMADPLPHSAASPSTSSHGYGRQVQQAQHQQMLGQPTAEEEALVTEVNRIRGAGGMDFRRILGVQSNEAWDMHAVQSRYRNIMRMLHPDKRSKSAEARAGGAEACDEAITAVQLALESAKREIGNGADLDPSQNLQQGMRRMQEVQRARARQAAQMQQARQQQSEVGSLAADLEKALAGSGGANTAGTCGGAAAADDTSQQIVNLLAQLGRGKA